MDGRPLCSDSDFYVRELEDDRTYIMVTFKPYTKDTFHIAKIRESKDGERLVIHIGRRYAGFTRGTPEEAITQTKRLLAKYFRYDYDG